MPAAALVRKVLERKQRDAPWERDVCVSGETRNLLGEMVCLPVPAPTISTTLAKSTNGSSTSAEKLSIATACAERAACSLAVVAAASAWGKTQINA